MKLHLRSRPLSSLDDLGPLLEAQLGPLLEQARSDGPEGASLIALFDVLDDAGQHRFDLHLFCGDDGQVYRAGTTEYVASFSQGGATGSADTALLRALNDAHARWVATARLSGPR